MEQSRVLKTRSSHGLSSSLKPSCNHSILYLKLHFFIRLNCTCRVSILRQEVRTKKQKEQHQNPMISISSFWSRWVLCFFRSESILSISRFWACNSEKVPNDFFFCYANADNWWLISLLCNAEGVRELFNFILLSMLKLTTSSVLKCKQKWVDKTYFCLYFITDGLLHLRRICFQNIIMGVFV